MSAAAIDRVREQFGPFDGRTWLNAAHQGPLPKPARIALETVAAEKTAPHRITDEAFAAVPRALKQALAPFIGAQPGEIILGNSTSYGIHLLAQGLRLREGDEILLVSGDFPATVVPWLWLRERGVSVRMLEPRTRPLDAAQLAEELSPRTRLFCSSWVFSFSGEAIDVDSLGEVCRERGVYFALNATQGVGARPIDVRETAVDALVSCGFKWLCGPYATGFCWLHPDLLDTLDYHQDYWLAQMEQTDLAQEGEYRLRDDLGASRYDVFGTANFFNFVPWRAALEMLGGVGIEAIAAHGQRLIDVIVSELDGDSRLTVLSPRSGRARSTIALISHVDPDRNEQLSAALREAGIDVALRAGRIRFSPHVYNDETEVRDAISVLKRSA